MPKFLLGHNTRVNPPNPAKESPKPVPCACGCGTLATPGRRYVSGHNALGRPMKDATREKLRAANSGERNHMWGKKPPNYKGGRTVSPKGYVELLTPDHPSKNGRYVCEHRLIVERHLRETDPASPFLTPGGYLRPDVDVHHVNEMTGDNRLENLRPMWRADHAKHHRENLGIRSKRNVLSATRDMRAARAGEIAERTGLSRSYTGKLLHELEHEGLVHAIRWHYESGSVSAPLVWTALTKGTPI